MAPANCSPQRGGNYIFPCDCAENLAQYLHYLKRQKETHSKSKVNGHIAQVFGNRCFTNPEIVPMPSLSRSDFHSQIFTGKLNRKKIQRKNNINGQGSEYVLKICTTEKPGDFFYALNDRHLIFKRRVFDYCPICVDNLLPWRPCLGSTTK